MYTRYTCGQQTLHLNGFPVEALRRYIQMVYINIESKKIKKSGLIILHLFHSACHMVGATCTYIALEHANVKIKQVYTNLVRV